MLYIILDRWCVIINVSFRIYSGGTMFSGGFYIIAYSFKLRIHLSKIFSILAYCYMFYDPFKQDF